MALSGFEPLADGCAVCGRPEPEKPVLDAVHGVVCCAACREKGGLAMPLSPAALAALRHVLYCPDKKLYSFTLDTPALRQLGQAAEVYVTAQLGAASGRWTTINPFCRKRNLHMTDLFEKSIRTLELPAVLEKLAAKAVSDAAKERCLRLTPATDTQEVLHLLDETDAAKERLGLHGSPSFSGVKDVSAALTRADHGGMLNTRELLDVAGVLTASRRVSEYDAQRQGEATVLDRLFSSLHTNRYLEDKIRSAILDEETIADTASGELADIRRKMLAAARSQGPADPAPAASSGPPLLCQGPAGGPHHPAGRPLRGAGEGRVQGQSAGSGPRHLLLRCHAVRGAYGRGAGQQRAQGAGGP